MVRPREESHSRQRIKQHDDHEGEEQLLQRRNRLDEDLEGSPQSLKYLHNSHDSPDNTDDHKQLKDYICIVADHVEEEREPAK
jgi:hypothetical protein